MKIGQAECVVCDSHAGICCGQSCGRVISACAERSESKLPAKSEEGLEASEVWRDSIN